VPDDAPPWEVPRGLRRILRRAPLLPLNRCEDANLTQV